MKKHGFMVLLFAAMHSVRGEDFPPMILARQPASVWRGPTHYRVTYPDGRSETWWYSSNGVYQVNGRTYRAGALGYEGPGGERYRKIGTSWQRMGTNPLTIRQYSTFTYIVGASRYNVVGSGLYRVSSSPFPRETSPTNPVIRMKYSRPGAFR